MNRSLLGGLSPRAFLARHWQQRPLLVRNALPDFRPPAGRALLERLSARDDVESRLVLRRKAGWQVEHGPFTRARLARLPRADWTLLVSGLNLHLPAADALLRRFAFLPQARLDDVMVSLAAPGGGVGPHADAYDVFLLQGTGRRVWRIARPQAFAEVPDAPLKLIDGFEPEEEYLLEPGDLLYLPPGWGHDGVALDTCTTWSIGFRAPGGAELCTGFLDWLQARGFADRCYRDPGIAPTTRSAQLPKSMIAHARRSLSAIRWTPREAAQFLGMTLSTPKPLVVFTQHRMPAAAAFARRLARSAVVLDARSQLLHDGATFYVNGESLRPPARARAALARLADARRAPGPALARAGLAALLREWYGHGWISLVPAR
ncbi:MAG TPA: cupin domain-containing protein [Burkholderiales bacterium]